MGGPLAEQPWWSWVQWFNSISSIESTKGKRQKEKNGSTQAARFRFFGCFFGAVAHKSLLFLSAVGGAQSIAVLRVLLSILYSATVARVSLPLVVLTQSSPAAPDETEAARATVLPRRRASYAPAVPALRLLLVLLPHTSGMGWNERSVSQSASSDPRQ